MNGAMSLVVTMISLAGLYALLSAKLIFALQLDHLRRGDHVADPLHHHVSQYPGEGSAGGKGRWLYLLGGMVVIIAPSPCFSSRSSRPCPAADTTIVGGGFRRGQGSWPGSLSGLAAAL
jgi:NADH-quinone oxidoreductase subunit J